MMHILFASIENFITKEEYVENWRQSSVKQMIDFQIPASITLAQGILESGNGNSELAKKANNHFGIKCHDWSGAKVYFDDDSKNECFRAYQNAEESFLDHSMFLKKQPRYSKLFLMETQDYKNWALGLKQAGYATNPKYADLLIEIIENLKLYELDKLGQITLKNEITKNEIQKSSELLSHNVLSHSNGVNYIVAKKGDSFYKIAKEFKLGLWQLYRYNDFGPRKEFLEAGDIIYLQPKKRRSKDRDANYELKQNSTLRHISELEAIKLQSLMKMNKGILPDKKIDKGERVILR